MENLGWRIRRIWSTDWFKNPQAQLEPIFQELDTLRSGVVSDDPQEEKLAVLESQVLS